VALYADCLSKLGVKVPKRWVEVVAFDETSPVLSAGEMLWRANLLRAKCRDYNVDITALTSQAKPEASPSFVNERGEQYTGATARVLQARAAKTK